MSKNQVEEQFHNELDDAIDNLFNPYTPGEGEAAPDEGVQSQPDEESASATPEPEATPSAPAAETTSDLPKEFAEFEEILMTLEWEISETNIKKASDALSAIRPLFDEEKTSTLAEIFSHMEQIFEAMNVAPQSVPTSAPKTLKEGLQTLRAAYESDDMTLIEQTLIDPTLAELLRLGPSGTPLRAGPIIIAGLTAATAEDGIWRLGVASPPTWGRPAGSGTADRGAGPAPRRRSGFGPSGDFPGVAQPSRSEKGD